MGDSRAIIHWRICEVLFHVKIYAICFDSLFFYTLRCKSQFTNNINLIFCIWSKGYFSFHQRVFSFLVSNKCPRQRKIFFFTSSFKFWYVFLSCLALVNSSFMFKLYTRQHSKVASTKLHTAISCIILLEWEERLGELMHLS